jgi:hypothetical protein
VKNFDVRWFLTREGTWSARVCFTGNEEGVVVHTHETMRSTALRAGSTPIANVIEEAELEASQ